MICCLDVAHIRNIQVEATRTNIDSGNHPPSEFEGNISSLLHGGRGNSETRWDSAVPSPFAQPEKARRHSIFLLDQESGLLSFYHLLSSFRHLPSFVICSY